MKKYWKVGVVAVIVLAAAAAWVVHSRATARPPVDRVIFLGFDGAGPNIIDPLVAQGKLPTIQRLMREGAYGHIQTFRPTESGILWTSIATGKTMLKHGVIDWTYVKKAGLQVPYEDPARKVKTYWEILSERGVKTGTLNWWWTYPPAPIQNGYLVSDRWRLTTITRPAPDTVYPPGIYETVKDLVLKRRPDILDEMHKQGIPEWKAEDAHIEFGGSIKILQAYEKYFAQDMSVDRASDVLWERDPVPVFSTYFRLIDVTSHFAWHFIDPVLYHELAEKEKAGQLTEADVARIDLDFARVVAPVYEFMDRTIAKYIQRMDDRTALVICSDHGFMFSNGAYAHADWARSAPDGVVFVLGPGVRKGARIQGAKLFNIAPTILYLIGQPVALDMDGGILPGAFDEAYLDRHPVRTIATYETTQRKTGTTTTEKTEMDEKILEDLQTLGYIQGPGSANPGAAPQTQTSAPPPPPEHHKKPKQPKVHRQK